MNIGQCGKTFELLVVQFGPIAVGREYFYRFFSTCVNYPQIALAVVFYLRYACIECRIAFADALQRGIVVAVVRYKFPVLEFKESRAE